MKLKTGNAAGADIPNTMQFFSIHNHALLHQMEIPNVEQINNIYVVPVAIAERLLGL